uniref:Uncharacterized protein n=1 Tax=Cladonia uncialis subsp. uncialis TaxID=180999 RepID=A0A2K9YEQ4_CLAUC|nr:hypothetical protein [Cladonia uncialis subsp. uncialis]
MPSYAARQPIDAGVASSSLISSSPWDSTPVLSEQMEQVSNSGDTCSPTCHSLDAVVGCQSVFSLDIYVNSASKKERCEVNLKGLNDNLSIPDDLCSLERVLDLVFPANQKVSMDISNQVSRPGQADIALDLFETFTRRFIACLTLLRTPALCTFDKSLWKHRAAPYVMLEFLRQLSHEACDLFQHISSEVNKFANSKHQKKTFTRAKGSIAFAMGVIHTSIQSFASGKDDWAESHFMPESLYDLTPEVSGQLQWLDPMLTLFHSNRRYSFVNVIGSRMPRDLEPIVPEPPVRVVQPNAPALQPQSQEERIASDLLHAAELDLELCETTQAEQYTLDCDTKCSDTPSTSSPLENSLIPEYRKDSESKVIPLPPEARLKTEKRIRQLESQCKQKDTAIRQLQIQKANLERTIETCKDGLASEPRQTRTKPIFTEMDIIPEATNHDSEEYGARSSASPSCSGKTTLVEHNDELDKRVGSNDKLSFCDPMDITSLDTESTFKRDVASQPTGAHHPQQSKRSYPHPDTKSPSKRKRLSLLSSKRPAFMSIVHQTTEDLETEAEHTEKAGKPITNHRLSKNRLSQLLHYKQQTQRDPEEGLLVINSSRPQSYPLASLRRSVVLSVKTITEAFESLHVAANSGTSSQFLA